MKNTSKTNTKRKVYLNPFQATYTPKTKAALRNFIKTAKKKDLTKVGIGILTDYNTEIKDDPNTYLKPGEIHFLFPAKWFDFIPEGLSVVSVLGEKEKFSKKRFHKDDTRYGMLSFGFIRKF